METKICPRCGQPTPSVLSRCRNCGERLSEAPTKVPEIVPSQRNGFVTFYLWLGVVINSLMTVAYFATIFTRKGLWSAYDPMSSRVFGFVSSAFIVTGYIMVLKWRKSGFYLLFGMGLVSLISNFMSGSSIGLATFFPLVSIFILFAVLQIRRNGKSCWEQLK